MTQGSLFWLSFSSVSVAALFLISPLYVELLQGDVLVSPLFPSSMLRGLIV